MPPRLSPTPEEFEVKPRQGGRRIDAYLSARYPSLSRASVQKLIDAEAVQLNGQTVKPSTKVKEGDIIRIWMPDFGDGTITPEDIPIEVVYEDEGFVVVNKPPGMVVHPARGNWSGTLVNALQFHFDTLSTVSGTERPGIIHRLDRDTTGLVIVGKEDVAHRTIARQFEDRVVDKEYHALVYGVPSRDSDYIERPIGHHPTVREKMAVRTLEEGAREAVTFYEVLERFDGYAYVRCRPKTGRTHQIRVHLTHIGHPIVADKLYAGRDRLTLADLRTPGLPPPARARSASASASPGAEPAADPGDLLIERQALHAHRIKFAHPVSGLPIEFTAALSADFVRALQALRTHRPLRPEPSRPGR